MSAPPANMSGKGLMFVNSRITSPLLDEATFLKWYDEDHIPEILATGGMPTAIRFIDEGARAQLKDHGNDSPSPAARPYLHVYPVQDVAFFRTSQFADIGVTSDLLPGSKLVYDLADFDVRFYNLVQVYDPTNKGPRHTRSMLYAHLALKEGYPEEDLERWYREEVSLCPPALSVSCHHDRAGCAISAVQITLLTVVCDSSTSPTSPRLMGIFGRRGTGSSGAATARRRGPSRLVRSPRPSQPPPRGCLSGSHCTSLRRTRWTLPSWSGR